MTAAPRSADPILLALVLAYGAIATVLEGLIAAGALIAQLLDLLAGRTPATAPASPAAPAVAADPVPVPAVVAAAIATGMPASRLSAVQLRQLARHTGLPRWWSANRSTCLIALGALS